MIDSNTPYDHDFFAAGTEADFVSTLLAQVDAEVVAPGTVIEKVSIGAGAPAPVTPTGAVETFTASVATLTAILSLYL